MQILLINIENTTKQGKYHCLPQICGGITHKTLKLNKKQENIEEKH